jgi:threonine dehydratase
MAVDLSDIQQARVILEDIINATPVLSDRTISANIVAEAFLKAE